MNVGVDEGRSHQPTLQVDLSGAVAPTACTVVVPNEDNSIALADQRGGTRVSRRVDPAPDEDSGWADHRRAQIGGRSSYGMDSTVVV